MPPMIHCFNNPCSTDGWNPIDDGVMGGLSFSQIYFDARGYAVFEGEVSLQNNGGFASVRAKSLPLGGVDTIAYLLSVWGDGKTYKLNLRTDSRFDGVNYQASFTPLPGQWTLTALSLAAFLPNFRGKLLQGEPPLRPDAVAQVGLMISDRQAGPFRIFVQRIEAVAAVLNLARPVP